MVILRTTIQHSQQRHQQRHLPSAVQKWRHVKMTSFYKEYAISQLRIVRSGLHLVTYLDVGNFRDKRTENTLHEICVQGFIRFSDSNKSNQSVRLFANWLSLLASVNRRKTCPKLHVRLLLWSKLPTYFDDVMTIEMTSRQSASARGHWCDVSCDIPYYVISSTFTVSS